MIYQNLQAENINVKALYSSVSRSLQAHFSDAIQAADFGVSTSSNDNKAAINAAIASASANGLAIIFPAGTIKTSGPHTITNSMGPILAGATTFLATGTTTDGFIFSGTNTTVGHQFGTISGFTNRGLVLTDANFTNIDIGNILGCAIGLSFEVVSGTCLNNTVTFNEIANCTTNAIRFYSTTANATLQRNAIEGNYIYNNRSAFDINLPSADVNCTENYFFCNAVDGNNYASSTGLTITSGTIEQSLFDVPGFFGNFTGTWVKTGTACNYNLALLGNFTYSQFIIPAGNSIINNRYYRGINNAPVPASTTSNNRASWNSGNPIPFQSIQINLPLPTLTAFQAADFYIYHPFTPGNCHAYSYSPQFASQPVIVTAVEDESYIAGSDGNLVANQIHIRVLALAAITGVTNVQMTIYFNPGAT